MSPLTWQCRAALGACLTFGASPLVHAQTAPELPTLDPSIPFIADNLNGTGEVDLGPNDLHLTAADGVFSGTLIGTGGLHISGGRQALFGDNRYSGGTTVSQHARVAIDRHESLGTGALTLNGGGLSVTRSMDTDRVIEFGEEGASITTLDGVVLNQRGDLRGPGGLEKLGAGTLVVSGNNTFAGGTRIKDGTIRIDDGSSLGTGAILLEGGMLETSSTLVTDQPISSSGASGVDVTEGTDTMLAGAINAIADDPCFMKVGGGELNIAGQANLRSGACVRGGSLRVDGDLAGAFVRVDAAGTLRGEGYIRAPLDVEGMLAPGSSASAGILHVDGAVKMYPGATLQIDIDNTADADGASNYSRLAITGADSTFIANGTLAPVVGDESVAAPGSSYRIVDAEGGISGRFTSIAQPEAGLEPNTRFVAFYGTAGGRAIDLRVAPSSYVRWLGPQATRNSLSGARVLDALVKAQDTATETGAQGALLYAATGLNAASVAPIVKQLAGEVHADAAAAARYAGLGIQRDVSNHLAAGVNGNRTHGAWANVSRDGQRTGSDGHGDGFGSHTDRTMLGVDLYASAETVIGVAAANYTTRVAPSTGSATVRGTTWMAYAQQALGPLVLDGVVAHGVSSWKTRRADPFGSTSLDARGSGHDSMAGLMLRLPSASEGAHHLEPYISAVWQKTSRDAMNERGTSPAALAVDKLSATGTRIETGAAWRSAATDPFANRFTWRVGVAIGTDTGDLLAPKVHATLAGMRLDTAAPQAGRVFAQGGAHGTLRLGAQAHLYAGVTGEVRARQAAVGAAAGLRVVF